MRPGTNRFLWLRNSGCECVLNCPSRSWTSLRRRLHTGGDPTACGAVVAADSDVYEEADWSTTKQWLFVTDESLAQFAAPALETPPSHTSQHLSPYMRLMISVIEDLGITPTNQPNLESLKKEFTDRWQKLANEKLSDRLAHAMASLVRDPESQGGRDKSRSKINK